MSNIKSTDYTEELVSDLNEKVVTIKNDIGTEELPTTAKTLKGAIAETFQSVSNGKKINC